MKTERFCGDYICGSGDQAFLHLIEQSFSMLDVSATLPYLKMLYKSEMDMLSEGFIWGSGWWIQNSYGFTTGAVPLLDRLWFSKLQNAYDAFWSRIGDGKRLGADNGKPVEPILNVCAPDGSLGDTAGPNGIVYKQGDGDISKYDWFYEATAAGVLMEADMLLFERNMEKIRKYLPLMRRSINFIEKTRDASGLLLVGASSNLLAPSYGGSFDAKTNTLGKGYLTGAIITYSAALKKCAELYRMVEDAEGESECRRRLARNLEALPRLLTEEGYFLKALDPDGTMHGVYGAEDHGYLEGVCNVDAIAHGVVDQKTAESIYQKIASVPGIRPHGIMCNNYPHLDDTVLHYLRHTKEKDQFDWKSGDWVDGGCWGTVEGRAVLAYLKLGKYADAYRSCRYYMDWAEEYRQDAPFSQWGANSNNPWQKETDDHSVCERPVAIMIDNFATVTCLLRGLFDYEADAEGLLLTVQIPDSITEYAQSVPIYFGGCRIYLSYRKSETVTAELDGKPVNCCGKTIRIPAEALHSGGKAWLTIGGAEPAVPREEAAIPSSAPEGMDASLMTVYADCYARLQKTTDPMDAAMLTDILKTCRIAAKRNALPFDRHVLRPMTEERIAGILEAYVKTPQELYQGYLAHAKD